MKFNFQTNTIIFDLDGTLIDSAPDVCLALNATLKAYGLNTIKPEHIFSLMGGGYKTMVTRAFAENGMSLTNESAKEAQAYYLNYYQANPVVETKIYPGVIELLKQLKVSGIKLGICTNKPGVMARLVLKELDLERYFDVVIAGDETSHPKPHGDHAYEVMNRMGIDPVHAVLVGDSKADATCAQNADIPFVGVSYGYQLRKGSVTRMIDHIQELPRALKGLVYPELTYGSRLMAGR